MEWDRTTQAYYYTSTRTGRSQWAAPAGLPVEARAWRERWDGGTRAYYYVNDATGESTWEAPDLFAPCLGD